MTPDWWCRAEPEVNLVFRGFTDRLRLKLNQEPASILQRKNPFLLRLRVVTGVQELARMVIDAFLSSSEETIFGMRLDDIAVAICKHARGGRKSGIKGIDLEYEREGTRVIMQVKSGPNWSNSSSRPKQEEQFRAAIKTLRQNSQVEWVDCIEGCAYGPSIIQDRSFYRIMIGNCFWEEISGWDGTAHAVMGILTEHASDGLQDDRRAAGDRMAKYLSDARVYSGGQLHWDRLLDLVFKA